MEIHKKCNILEFILILPTHLVAKIKLFLIDPCHKLIFKQNTGIIYYTIKKKFNIYKEKADSLSHSFRLLSLSSFFTLKFIIGG